MALLHATIDLLFSIERSILPVEEKPSLYTYLFLQLNVNCLPISAPEKEKCLHTVTGKVVGEGGDGFVVLGGWVLFKTKFS